MTSLRLNGYLLDLEQGDLRDPRGRRVQLRPQALAVLLELARRPGELITKSDLNARVWPGVSVTDDSLVQCVVEIRRALNDSRQRVVRTMPRRGYLLIVDAADSGRVIAIGQVRMHAEKLRDRCVMTTFDPDTQVQDPSILLRIVRELDGSTALDSSVIHPGKIRVGDAAHIVGR